ncbi:MAG: hypothetical protein WCJ30_21965, partial [Deltaproteobacteria bacterium]
MRPRALLVALAALGASARAAAQSPATPARRTVPVTDTITVRASRPAREAIRRTIDRDEAQRIPG